MHMAESAVVALADPLALPSEPIDQPIRNPQSTIRNHLHLIGLLSLIVIGGLLRFSFLDRPPIWFDEAATFARTCGTYQELLDALEESGFGPLHYHVYWWIKNGMPLWGRIENVRVSAFVRGDGLGRIKPGAGKDGRVDARNLIPLHPLIKDGRVLMTPVVLRLIPAICGTLL